MRFGRKGRELEKTVEKDFVDDAKKFGLLGIKMNLLGRRAWPDRMFLGKRRVIFFVEFKRLGEEPTEQQADVHKTIRNWGFRVYVVDKKEQAERVIKEELKFYP